MEQKNKEKAFTIEVKGNNGTEKTITSSACAVLAVTDVGTERLLFVNATGEDLLHLYKALVRVKKLIEASSPRLKTFFNMLELCDGEVADVD